MLVVAELADSSTKVMNTKCRRLIINTNCNWNDVLLFHFMVCSGKKKKLSKLAENKLGNALAVTRNFWCLY